ncbi:MAG: ribonuclease P protein component [Candidatus Moranbacteria bacterium]|nr:ribonuclease P protein component [Candidatus Moranbacteria bacterium]
MLPAKNRLTRKDDFQRVYQKGTFFSFGDITLKATENSQKETRVGFLIEKKTTKKAAKRNKIKRLLREAFSRQLKRIKPGFDVVVFYKGKERIGKFQQVDLAVKKLLEKSGLIKAK